MPCAGMDAAKFLLCWLHESLCCILCSLICVLASKIIYLFYRWRGKCVKLHVSEPLLETPVPKRMLSSRWWRLGMGWDVRVVG